MKYKLSYILVLLLCGITKSIAQTPSAFNYQAVVRDSDANLIRDSEVAFKIGILKGSIEGQMVYSETHNVRTSSLGTVVMEIGAGSNVQGIFNDIQWGENIFFIQTALDLNNGTNFEIISTTQLLSVPYALHSKTTSDKIWSITDSDIYYNDGKVGVGTNNPEYDLDIEGKINAKEFFLDGEPFTPTSPWNQIDNNLYYNSGNIGVGTSSPGYLFDLNAKVSDGNRTFLNIQNTDESNISSAALEVKSGSQENYTVLRMHGDNYSYSWWGKHGQLRTTGDGLIIEATKANNSGGDIVFVNGATGGSQNIKTINMKINGNGNVGIGTEDPAYKLHVEGIINSTEYYLDGEPFSQPWNQSNNDLFYNSGNIGVGTSSPSYLFDLNGNVSTGNRTFFNIQNNDVSSTSSAALEVKSGSNENYTVLRMHGDSFSYSWWGKHGQLRTTGDGLIIEATKVDNSGGDIVFVNGATGGSQNIKTINMKINGAGNVGIGTDNPKSKLHVKSGDIYLEDVNNGVIMKSPDGNCWRLTVDNMGAIATTGITCP